MTQEPLEQSPDLATSPQETPQQGTQASPQLQSGQQPSQQGGQQFQSMPQSQGMSQPSQQQFQQPKRSQGVSQQSQGVQQGGMSQSEGRLESALTQEMQQALQQFVAAQKVCEWCADRCAGEGPMMAECLRLCRDVADIAAMNASFIARDSSFGPQLATVFIDAAQACAQECAQHSHEHCQDCARVLSEAVQTTQQMLDSLQSSGSQGGQQLAGAGQTGGQSPGF